MVVHRIAVEATAELVVNAAAGHFVQRQLDDVEEVFVAAVVPVPQQAVEVGGVGEFRLRAEAAVHHVHVAGEGAHTVRYEIERQIAAAGRKARKFLHGLANLSGALDDVLLAVVIGIGQGAQETRKAGAAVAVVGRKVGAAVEGFLVRGEEHGQRPAALPGEQLHGGLVDVIQVGTFLAVHLDVHEVRIHQRGNLLILERFALHDVAPVAGGVADGQQNGPVLGVGFVERLRSPGIPVDRIVGVLQQIGAGFVDQAIGALGIHDSLHG